MTPFRPTAWHSPVCPRGLRQVNSPGGSRRTKSQVRSMAWRWARFGPAASLWADVAHHECPFANSEALKPTPRV
jgi:hypothetical protein